MVLHGNAKIRTVFFDLGGVCLSNGWDHEQRRAIADRFQFDYDAFDLRHRLIIDTLERGQCTLDDYLQWTLFYLPRAFSIGEIKAAMFALSTEFRQTLQLVDALRRTGGVLLATLNNESRELNEERINRFGLRGRFSAFFSSCYLGLLKPQPDMFRRALQITQCAPAECIFVDDRPMNVEVAAIIGMHAIQFTDAPALARSLQDAGVLLP